VKNFLILTLIFFASFTAKSQCLFQQCVGATGQVTAIDQSTGVAFDMSTHTIVWSSTLPGFTVAPAGNQILWANVGSTVGTFNVSYTVTNSGSCDSVYTGCVEVIDAPIPTYASQSICPNTSTTIVASGGSPAGGVYSVGGVPITNIDSSMIGQNVVYTYTSTCGSQTASAVVTGLPVPNPGAVGGP
jgi:hypothetical protein